MLELALLVFLFTWGYLIYHFGYMIMIPILGYIIYRIIRAAMFSSYMLITGEIQPWFVHTRKFWCQRSSFSGFLSDVWNEDMRRLKLIFNK